MLTSLGGCKVGLRVGVNADERGGGDVHAAVTLDKDAQRYAGDLKGQLRVDDLVKAGWKIVGPETIDKGAVRVTATKPFAKPEQVVAIVAELDGASGLFDKFRLHQERSFLKTTTKFDGTVDLRQGIEAFSDDRLRAQLGSPLGATPEEFSRRIGTELADALLVTVGVRLPGQLSSNAPQSTGGAANWHPRLGEDVQLSASSTHWNVRGVGLAAFSALAGALGVVSALRLRRRNRSAATPHP